jgi:hypothetical protein
VSTALSVRLAQARWLARTGAPQTSRELAAPSTAADLLALLSIARHDPRFRDSALRAVDARLASPVRDTDGLGWLERGEVALAAHGVAHEATYLAAAQDAGEHLYGLKEETGRWLPECLLADQYNLSLVVGLGGIAHFFLQLASPGHVKSYRVLE